MTAVGLFAGRGDIVVAFFLAMLVGIWIGWHARGLLFYMRRRARIDLSGRSRRDAIRARRQSGAMLAQVMFWLAVTAVLLTIAISPWLPIR